MASGDKQPTKSKMGKDPESLKTKTLNSERRSADYLGGRAQPASGAGDCHKGDIKLENWLIDKKETTAQSIMVYGKDLTKITREADGEDKNPALLIQMEGVPSTVSNEWIVLPLDIFSELFT